MGQGSERETGFMIYIRDNKPRQDKSISNQKETLPNAQVKGMRVEAESKKRSVTGLTKRERKPQ